MKTPPPRLVRSTPRSGATGLEPKTTLSFRFNQPVDPEVLTRVSSLVATTAGKARPLKFSVKRPDPQQPKRCLLYTSDAADERSSVDLGGRRIIQKKKHARTWIELTDDNKILKTAKEKKRIKQ